MKSVLLLICCTITLLGTAQAVDSKNQVILNRVDSYLELGEHKKAINLLNDRLDESPKDIDLLNKRAAIHVFIQKEKLAKADLRRAMNIDKKDAGTMLIYSQLKFHNHDVDSAIWFADRGLNFDPNPNEMESLYSLKGNILMREDRYEEAEDCLIKAASCPKVSQETMRNLASVLNSNDKNDEAVAVLDETLEIFGHSEETLINAGYISNQLGNYDDAIVYLNDALALDSDNPYTLANLANSYVNIGGLTQAKEYINRSLANDNTNPYAYRVKGDCFMATGEYERACKEYRRAIKMGYALVYSKNEIDLLIKESCGT